MDSELIDRLLNMREITAQTGLSQSTIRRLVKAGKFPKPLLVGRRAKRWRVSSVNAWLHGLEASDGET